jgi:hypothetical protein
MKYFAVVGDSCHVYSSSSLLASDQVQRSGYSKSEVEIDVAALQFETSTVALELETDAATLELEMDVASLELEASSPAPELEIALDLDMKTDVPQELSKQERYSTD